MKKKEIIEFINKYKGSVGFGNFGVNITIKKDVKEDCFAEIEVERFMKVIKIDIYKDFFKKSVELQKEDLLHELIHGRVALKDDIVEKSIDKIKENEEEDMVNDIICLMVRWGEK